MARTAVLLLFTALVLTSHAFNLCETDSDCKVEGCKCEILAAGVPTCNVADKKSLRKALPKCKTCLSDADCDYLGCNTGIEFCNSCAAEIINAASSRCSGVQLQFCRADSHCSGTCTCMKESGGLGLPFSNCINSKGYELALAKCKSCTSNDDCPKSECSRNISNRRVCTNCPSLAKANILDCSAPNTTTPVTEPTTLIDSSPSADAPTPTTDPSASGDTAANAVPDQTQSPAPPCVSTEWLYREGLAHSIIRHAGSAEVLCIPGLPCGTHGHVVRDSNSKLVTYRKACERRTDCVESTMPVSQLSHTFDWSQVRSSDGQLSLTSLSVNPDSSGWSISRVIAFAADRLNHAGLGFVCDAIALFPNQITTGNVARVFAESE